MSSSVTALSLYMGSRGFLLEPIPAVCGLIAGPSPMAAAHQEQFGGSVLCSRHFEPVTFRSLTILIYKMINNDVKEFVRELTAIRTDCCKKIQLINMLLLWCWSAAQQRPTEPNRIHSSICWCRSLWRGEWVRKWREEADGWSGVYFRRLQLKYRAVREHAVTLGPDNFSPGESKATIITTVRAPPSSTTGHRSLY